MLAALRSQTRLAERYLDERAAVPDARLPLGLLCGPEFADELCSLASSVLEVPGELSHRPGCRGLTMECFDAVATLGPAGPCQRSAALGATRPLLLSFTRADGIRCVVELSPSAGDAEHRRRASTEMLYHLLGDVAICNSNSSHRASSVG